MDPGRAGPGNARRESGLWRASTGGLLEATTACKRLSSARKRAGANKRARERSTARGRAPPPGRGSSEPRRAGGSRAKWAGRARARHPGDSGCEDIAGESGTITGRGISAPRSARTARAKLAGPPPARASPSPELRADLERSGRGHLGISKTPPRASPSPGNHLPRRGPGQQQNCRRHRVPRNFKNLDDDNSTSAPRKRGHLAPRPRFP